MGCDGQEWGSLYRWVEVPAADKSGALCIGWAEGWMGVLSEGMGRLELDPCEGALWGLRPGCNGWLLCMPLCIGKEKPKGHGRAKRWAEE